MAQSGFTLAHYENKHYSLVYSTILVFLSVSDAVYHTHSTHTVILSVVKPHWLVRGMGVLIPLSDQTDAAPEQRGVQCECVCLCVTLSAGHWSVCVWLRLICCCEIFRFYILSKSLQIHFDTHIMGSSFECWRKDLNSHRHTVHHVLLCNII